MNYLLDTHTFLWVLFEPEKLSSWARKEIRDPKNRVAVSIVTFWEISLKYSLGKLELHNVSPADLPGAAQEVPLDIIPLRAEEAASFHRLPRLAHKDPFDRMMIWQGIGNRMTLISKDKEFRSYRDYGLRVRW
ncbi:MAG: type II toxin-antitoxin system VapC family toxin [Deltaproteobacteria bacterium]|nr:type II toxin-antitoxin system VapC family toxin [Deltaproteobacteria bacterium]